jgi:methyl-accepting chemotaxis protein
VTTELTSAGPDHGVDSATRPVRVSLLGAETLLLVIALGGAGALGLVAAGARGSAGAGITGVAFAAWLVLAIGASLVIRRSRLARVTTAIDALNRIAEGDLRRDVTGAVRSEDEAGAIEAAADRLAERLRAEVTTLEVAARGIHTRWNEIYKLGVEMLQMCEGTVHDASVAATSAEQVSQNMQHIASATVEMATTVRNIAGHAAQASSVAMAGAAQVAQASGTMTELEQASAEVQDVVELISSIASQTRVLALNATIEAGRAGEAGRGFVVVADNVKGLAKKTADATEQVNATVRGIKSGSMSAVEVMAQITEMIKQVSDNQTAIASAVEEQTATTSEVGQSSAVVADNAVDLARSVSALTHALRVTAYVGAQAKTVAAQLTDLESSIKNISDHYAFDRAEVAEVAAVERSLGSGVVVEGKITRIQDYVEGTGLNQFSYDGRWEHGAGNVEADGSDSYCSIPGDTVTMRFVGTRVRFFGVRAENHGIADIYLDGQLMEEADEYAPHRIPGSMMFESSLLPRGEHTLQLKVTSRTNPQSKYYWFTVDYVEVED